MGNVVSEQLQCVPTTSPTKIPKNIDINNINDINIESSINNNNNNDSNNDVTKIVESYVLNKFEGFLGTNEFENAKLLMNLHNSINFMEFYLKNGDTVVHYAIRHNQIDFVQYLLKNNANPNIRNQLTQDTPLHIAINNLNIDIIKLLIKYGADMNMTNIFLKSPKDVAIKTDNNHVLKALGIISNVVTINTNVVISKININVKKRTTISSDDGTTILTPYDNSRTHTNYVDDNVLLTPLSLEEHKSLLTDDIFTDGSDKSIKSHSDTESISIETPIPNSNHTSIIQTSSQLRNEYMSLPILNDWLLKLSKSNSKKMQNNIKGKSTKLYKRRYVFVRDGHLIWNKSKPNNLNIYDKLDIETSKGYTGVMNLLLIKEIKILKTHKSKLYKFQINSRNILNRNKDKILIFRCQTKIIRDKWVDGINSYLNLLQNVNIQ